jgi:1-acyl-sn-glycerol-3-phosphate acyltransferase
MPCYDSLLFYFIFLALIAIVYLHLMKIVVAKLYFFLFRWKLDAQLTPEMRHSVLIGAPHTSNWDFPVALCALWLLRLRVRYLIKDYYTKSFFGLLFRWTGGVGVDLNQSTNMVQLSIAFLQSHNPMAIVLAPEGSRAAVERWKTGFYYIALGAGVPVSLGYLDYKSRTAGIGPYFYPTGDFEKDMSFIAEFYLDKTGKYPEQYNPKIY